MKEISVLTTDSKTVIFQSLSLSLVFNFSDSCIKASICMKYCLRDLTDLLTLWTLLKALNYLGRGKMERVLNLITFLTVLIAGASLY